MISRLFVLLAIAILLFSSCQTQTTQKQNNDITPLTQIKGNEGPDFNYSIEVPPGWSTHDTIMLNGLKVRLLSPSGTLNADNPVSNILIASMRGQNIDDFTTANINYLKANTDGIQILERGHIDSLTYNGRWFTYIRNQDGLVRDMINYIIPLKGFAYMITCGTTKGSMNKYRATFDKIVRSFKG